MGIRELIGAPDRPLMAHGPIVRLVVYMQAVCVVAAVAALTFTVILATDKASQAYSRAGSNFARLQAIQESRHNAAFDQCYVLQHVIYGAFGPKHRARARLLLKQNDLLSCTHHARRLSHTRPRTVHDLALTALTLAPRPKWVRDLTGLGP